MSLTAIAYFVSARVGYAFAVPQGVVTLWPPSGVMLGLLGRSRRRDWTAIVAGGLIGSVISDLLSGYSGLLAVAAALANAGESLIAGWVLTSLLGTPINLASVRAVVTIALGAAAMSNAVTALAGALVLNRGFGTPILYAWFVWWAGDGLGMLVVAPVLLAWRRMRLTIAPLRALEALLLIGALVGAAFLGVGAGSGELGIGAYITFPGLFLAAVRFGSSGAALASLLTAGVAIWSAALSAGPFVAPALSGAESALRLYIYLGTASLTSLILAAALEQQQVAAMRKAESDRRYRSVVETVTDAILVIDADSIIRFANAATQVTFGYSPDELVGRSLTELMPTKLGAEHRAALERYLATGHRRIGWHSVELTGLHRSGREIPIEVSFSETLEGGGRAFTGIIRDVTEKHRIQQSLREAEERMRFSLEASRVGIWEADLVSARAHWSETLEALHGMPPGSFAGTFEAFWERVHVDDRQAVRDAIEIALRSRTDFNILYRTTWPDRSTHWISSFGRTFCNVEGTPIRAAGIAMDVTERRAMEEQSLQTQKMETIGQLAGGVAHDFNNLLTAILGHAMLMAEALGPGNPHQADLAEIRLAAERATSLTGQLLAFSRRQILVPRVLRIGESVTALAPMLTRLIGESIEIVVRVSPDAGQVLADPGQVDQVILNLALNARDAMPDGGRLLIEVANVDLDEALARQHPDARAGRYVLLSVTDTGVGMDTQTVARAFEPFFTTKPKGQGTGLGLSTVYGVVKQSTGHIRVFSEPQQGSTFKVYLPRVDAPAARASAGPAVTPRRGTEAVLVVEDDQRIRQLVIRVLVNHGYRVTAASTPEEALALAVEGSRCDVLITDVVLPGISGRALAEKLGELQKDMRVLYMSGYTDEAIGRYGVLESGVAFLEKPFTPAALLNKLRQTLDSSERRARPE